MLSVIFSIATLALLVGIVLLFVKKIHKLIAIGIVGISLVVMFATVPEPRGEAETEPKTEEASKPAEAEKEAIELTRPEEIEANIEKVAKDQHGVHIEKVAVNGDDQNYVVLIDVKWDVKNKAKTTREMVRMMSDELADAVAGDDITEITTFWEIPYHLEGDNSAKFNYDGQGELTKDWFAPKLK